MAVDMERSVPEGGDLKAFINDLLGVVALPAVWRGGDPAQVARTLIDVLMGILHLDLAYVRLEGNAGGAPVEVARTARSEDTADLPRNMAQLLAGRLGNDPRHWLPLARMPFEGADIAVATLRLGSQGDGVLVAGSRRSQFPSQAERLLLNVAANQAAMGLQEARILSDQKSVAEELDRRVAQRTAALAAANAELRRSKAMLAEAQRLSATGSLTWHPDQDEVTWSDQTYRIFRIASDEAVTIRLIEDRIHPEDRPAFRQQIERARGGATEMEFDCRLQLPDGAVRYVHLVAHGSRDEDELLEYTGAIQDVTDRRLAEQALAKASSELSQVSRITTMGVLAASIAHEVNQPLSGVLTNANTCLRMLSGDPPDTEGASLAAKRLLRDGCRAADVIRRLRALFDKRTVVTELVDLNDAAKEVVALSWIDLQRNGIALRTELAEDLPPVRGDRVQLQQVMLNLVRNASDAMKLVEDRTRQLLVKTDLAEDGCVRLSVRDTGEGLAGQSADRLFNPFYTTKADGMGIGLSVSRSIIEHHGGRIWAAANDGPGATFSFVIPVGVAAEQLPRTEASSL